MAKLNLQILSVALLHDIFIAFKLFTEAEDHFDNDIFTDMCAEYSPDVRTLLFNAT